MAQIKNVELVRDRNLLDPDFSGTYMMLRRVVKLRWRAWGGEWSLEWRNCSHDLIQLKTCDLIWKQVFSYKGFFHLFTRVQESTSQYLFLYLNDYCIFRYCRIQVGSGSIILGQTIILCDVQGTSGHCSRFKLSLFKVQAVTVQGICGHCTRFKLSLFRVQAVFF